MTGQSDKRKFTRRGVMKTTAVGIGSAATIGGASKLGASPVGSASAVAPLAVGGAAGAVALGYLINEGVDTFTGSKKDYSNYTGFTALKRGIYADALEAKSADERVMTSIENNLKNSVNVAIAKGKAALVTKLNNDASQSEANTAMTEAVNRYYSTIQKNILTHGLAQIDKFADMGKSLITHPDAPNESSFFKIYNTLNENAYKDLRDAYLEDGTQTIDFINGDSRDYTYPALPVGTSQNSIKWKPVKSDNDGNDIPLFKFKNPDSQTDPPETSTYSFRRITDAFEKCVVKRDEVNAQLVGMASDLYNNYEPGEIPTEKVIDPVTAATELGNNTGVSIREAQAGMMGIPTSAGFSLRLELQDKSGEKFEVEAEIYTNAQPNDSSGNPAGFKVGKTYNPDNFENPIYVSYEYIDPESGERSTDFTEIVNPFTVLEATDSEGNEVQEVTPTSKTAQTTDIDSIEQELESIREEQQRLLQKQKPTGGGGGFLSGDIGSDTRTLGIVAGGAALAALLFGGNN